jgi:hypothetical protein
MQMFPTVTNITDECPININFNLTMLTIDLLHAHYSLVMNVTYLLFSVIVKNMSAL